MGTSRKWASSNYNFCGQDLRYLSPVSSYFTLCKQTRLLHSSEPDSDAWIDQLARFTRDLSRLVAIFPQPFSSSPPPSQPFFHSAQQIAHSEGRARSEFNSVRVAQTCLSLQSSPANYLFSSQFKRERDSWDSESEPEKTERKKGGVWELGWEARLWKR